MILSAREYARRYAGNCSTNTVIRKIQKDLLPTNHKGRKVGRDWVIEIQEFTHLADYEITTRRKLK